MFCTQNPDALEFVQDLHFVASAAKVESAFLAGEYARFKKTIAQLEGELKSARTQVRFLRERQPRRVDDLVILF